MPRTLHPPEIEGEMVAAPPIQTTNLPLPRTPLIGREQDWRPRAICSAGPAPGSFEPGSVWRAPGA